MLTGMITGTLAILVSQIGLVAALAGVGLLVRRAFGLGTASARDLLIGFWVGLAATMLFLTIWTFFFAVGTVPLVAVSVAGLAGLALALPDLRRLPERDPTVFRPGALILLGLGALWVANLCRGPLINTDTMLYHLQGVLWAKEYPTVPGLVNLFGPLGFNNASFLYDAMLNVGPWNGRAWHLANGVLIQALLAQGILGLVRVARGGGPGLGQGVFDAILIAPTTNMAIQDWLRSYATDLPSTAVLLVAASEAHRFLLGPDRNPAERGYTAVSILILLAVAVTFKVNLSVFAAITGILILWRLVRDRGLDRAIRRRALAWGLAGGLAIGLAWTGRGVILSGYVLFPTAFLSLPVDWRAPTEHAIGEFGYAAESARSTVENRAGILHEEPFAVWFRHWWELSGGYDLHTLLIPMILIAGLLGAWLIGRARGAVDPAPGPWVLMIAAAVGLITWFRVAPEPRYATPLIWTAMAVAAAAVYRMLDGARPRSVRRIAVALLVVVGASPLVIRPIASPERPWSRPPLKRVIEANLRVLGPPSGFYPRAGGPKVRRYVTESGLELNVTDRRCWDAALPCTPNPAPNLRLRVPGRLEKGFMVDGEWRMENWPAGRVTFRETWAERRRRERAQVK